MAADLNNRAVFFQTDALNVTGTNPGYPTGMLPSRIRDDGQTLMGALARDWDRRGPTVTSGGSANAQTLTYTVAQTAIVRGDTYGFIAGFTNTGAMTLAVSGMTAKAVQLGGAALRGMEIVAGLTYTVMYDGTAYQLVAGCLAFTPNTLINGGFEVWQRGAGGSASIALTASQTAYTADRWYLLTNANQASVVSQQTGLTNGSRFSARVQRNSGQTGTGVMVFAQPYTTDMLVPLRGSKITISGWLASGANWSPASGNLAVWFLVGTGTEGKRGGGFTSETSVITGTVALTAGSGATFFSFTSSAVLPTSTTQGEMHFEWTPVGTAGVNDHFTIDDVKVEANLGPTPFDRPLFADEMVRCRRFFQKSFPYATAQAQNAGIVGAFIVNNQIANGQPGGFIQFLPALRGIPNEFTTYNPSAANINWRNISASSDVNVSLDGPSAKGETGFHVMAGATVTTIAQFLGIHWVAGCDL